MRTVQFQLYKSGPGGMAGAAINDSGGKVYVAKDGDAAKETLYTSAGASQANPMSLTNGGAEIFLADSVSKVDLYIMAPGGQFIVQKGVKVGGAYDFVVDTDALFQTAVIPFAIGDTTATTETDTGFDIPTDALVQAEGMSVDVLTADATETIDVGILSSESGGDADGFMALVSVGTAVNAQPAATVTTGSNNTYLSATTYGALVRDFIAGEDTAAGGDGAINKKSHRCDGTAKSISYTLTAGTDTAKGFIHLPYRLAA